MDTSCQFFLSKKGCRNGTDCRFLHSATTPCSSSTAGTTTAPASAPPPAPAPASATSPSAMQPTKAPARAPGRAPVPKPVPKSLQNVDQGQEPASRRNFEISQIHSRFKQSFRIRGGTISRSIATATSEQEKDYSYDETFELKIVPSDPDFPYEIEALHIQLTVPKDYPHTPCNLIVLNTDIPKGFATNLERGFAEASIHKKTLLAHLNWLDVNMEQLLQKPPAPTIRFVGHGQQQAGASGSELVATGPVLPPPLPTPVPKPTPSPLASLPSSSSNPVRIKPPKRPTSPVQPIFTAEQIDQAALQRQKQLAQIQARFRATFETISPTEVQISLESADKSRMPVVWDGPLWVNLLIPKLFPLEPCEIRLKQDNLNPEIELWRARNVEQGFRKIVAAMPQLSLFQLLNQLNRDLKEFMSMPAPPTIAPVQRPTAAEQRSAPSVSSSTLSSTNAITGASGYSEPHSSTSRAANQKPKLIYVDAPNPPPRRNFEELGDHGMVTSEDEDGDDGEQHDDSDSDEDEERVNASKSGADSENASDQSETEENDQSAKGPVVETAPKRGLEIRMPDLKLEHISLMYCRSLNLLVRCNRCKGLFEIPDITPDDGRQGPADMRKWRTCENCQSLLGAHFRTEYIHMQSKTLGYLDLAGCTAFDILPSAFVPTCGECDQILGSSADSLSAALSVASIEDPKSTTTPSSELSSGQGSTVALASTSISVPTGFRQRVGRGMSATANCRKCHVRMTFSMEGETKFVKLSPGDLMKASAATLEQLPLKKKLVRKNKNGLDFELKVGEPLPRKGACDHYKKSRRWFRFPCCSKIYACHLCHDEKEADSHECEYAKRMICGHCSREQNVSDKPCVCGESPVKTTGGSGAFWEGGEGMRDRTRMSNKDSKKYRGANKTIAKKQVGAENVRKRAPKE